VNPATNDVGLPCVHCGLCLDTCPTYRVLGTEADSPRGRIYIMEDVDRGSLTLDAEVCEHLDGCLGCLACETACPSGVSFGERIERFRPVLRSQRRGARALWRQAAARIGNGRFLLAAGMAVAALLDTVGLARTRRRMPGLGLLPASARGALSALRPPRSARDRSTVPAPAEPRLRAAILTGCVADVLRPGISDAAVDVLHRHGIEVVDVEGASCCGALALHAGRHDEAVARARASVARFAAAGVDVIVTTAAGCGAMMRGYDRLLPGDADAAEVASRCRDVSEVVVEAGIEAAPGAVTGDVVYHDACHLKHAAGVVDAPRAVTAAATGRPPADLGDNSICCGSAGSYNVDNEDMGRELGRRKAELVRASGADVVTVGNIGCILQLERVLALEGLEVSVRHPVELLAAAYRGERVGSDDPR